MLVDGKDGVTCVSRWRKGEICESRGKSEEKKESVRGGEGRSASPAPKGQRSSSPSSSPGAGGGAPGGGAGAPDQQRMHALQRQEEEDLQLALAISQSEAEAKEKERQVCVWCGATSCDATNRVASDVCCLYKLLFVKGTCYCSIIPAAKNYSYYWSILNIGDMGTVIP